MENIEVIKKKSTTNTEKNEEAEALTEELKALDAKDYTVEIKEYHDLLAKNDNNYERTWFEYCYIHNIPYIDKVVQSFLDTPNPQILDFPRIYLKKVKQTKYRDLTFFDQLRQKNFERIYSEDESIALLDEETQKNRLAIIDIIGYDCFKDDDIKDKPQLYRDLSSMLTEGMRKDVPRAKAALSIVRNYNNMNKYQKSIDAILKSGNIDEETQKQLDQYMKIQKTLQDSINTTAEKNNFTAKGGVTSARSSLSEVINQIEEKGIDEGITNFYDIATSKSIQEVANISLEAILKQIKLSKTDYVEILTEQCKMVHEAQDKSRKALEAARLAKEKLAKQQLIDELEHDYRKKGITEDEIEAFINREYKMYDGTN